MNAPKGKPRSSASSKRTPSSGPPWLWIAGVAIVLVGVALVVASTGGGNDAPKGLPEFGRVAAPESVVAPVVSIPSSVTNQVGAGSIAQLPTRIAGTPATGKPEVLYIGAEFCPFCAAERWSIVNALSRFGRFTNLQATHSSATDSFPNTATFSFYGSSYQSDLLTFTPVEVQTNEPQGQSYKLLQRPTDAQDAIWGQFSPGGQKGYPFLYLDGRFTTEAIHYDPGVLAGLSLDSIANTMASETTGPVAQQETGGANVLTAALCEITKGQPTTTCDQPAIIALRAKLPTK